MLLLLSSRFLFFLEHLADAAQIVRGRDAEGKLEGTDVCCGILETALAGNVFCRMVWVLHENLCSIFCAKGVDVVLRSGRVGITMMTSIAMI